MQYGTAAGGGGVAAGVEVGGALEVSASMVVVGAGNVLGGGAGVEVRGGVVPRLGLCVAPGQNASSGHTAGEATPVVSDVLTRIYATSVPQAPPMRYKSGQSLSLRKGRLHTFLFYLGSCGEVS